MKYAGKTLKEISFPLGGIGSGSIGIGGNGRLLDWDIFNRPWKGSTNGYSHFAVKTVKNGNPQTFVMNGDLEKDLTGQYGGKTFNGYGFGSGIYTMCGFPHFREVEFDGAFPVAQLDFFDLNFPAKVKMTAFNPFIPCDAKNSSIPAAFFEIAVENTDNVTLEYQVAFSVANPYKVSRNYVQRQGGFHVLTLQNAGADRESPEYGDLSVATDCENVYTQTYWYRGGWMDSAESYWNDFNSAEPLKERMYDTDGSFDVGTIAASVTIKPREIKKVKFILSWNVPNNYNYWSEYKDSNGNHQTWKNYYSVLFEDSFASAVYSLEHWNSLYSRTMKFKEILHGSSFPDSVIDAISSNLSVLKSPTVLRLEDGSFYGWEGVGETRGSCEGTCQHVWNYAYALCFLFPELERSIRELEFKYSTAEDGRMGFRLLLPLGRGSSPHRACVDGQMGTVIKCYREWKLSGDNQWLANQWEMIQKILEYAWSEDNFDRWDRNKDGVLEGRQHHTLDVELFGTSSWLEGMYLAALKAAAEMAEFLGDEEKAHEYACLFYKGQKWSKENLFNGKYFIQKVDLWDKGIVDAFGASDKYWNEEEKEIKYQIADGSSIDQILAQWHADILGLGDIFDREQVWSALDEMMKHNFQPDMRKVTNTWRVFALNDEAGSMICNYPDSCRKPRIPIPYNTECMTGFEYSFAGLLYSRGRVQDGEKIVRAVRERFDGEKRNPWNEFECGSNYARSMASYALVPILSGFVFDLPKGHIGFRPYRTGNFETIWSVDGAWGRFAVTESGAILHVEEGGICLQSFGAHFLTNIKVVKIDGRTVKFCFEQGVLSFDPVQIVHDLEIQL